jgi:hypothetical protein
MTKGEARKIVKEHLKKDSVYTTLVESSGDYKGFLQQCKRAVNKMQQIPNASVKYEFFSGCATEQAARFMKSELVGMYPGHPLRDEKLADYNAILKMTNWEYLRKYGELHVQDGWYCVDFGFGDIVFAALSQFALIEMGVFTKEECDNYIDAYFILEN